MNVFDRTQYSSAEPRSAVAGDRWVWRRPDIAANYPTTDYSLSYRFTSQNNTSLEETASAVEVDGDYIVEMESATTEAFAAGSWVWEAIITRTSDSKTAVVDRGYVEVSAPATASHTFKVLQAIRATIEGTATHDQSRIEIGGRILERRSIKELTELEAMYARRWKSEQAAIDRAAGRSVSRVLVKMGA